jgi:NHL repeat
MATRLLIYFAIILLFFYTHLSASSNADTLRLELQDSFDAKTSKAGPLVNATAIDIDNSGNIYIVDRGKHRLIKFSPDGYIINEVGGFGTAPEKFDDPRDVSSFTTLDVFVADFNNNRIVRFDRNLNFLSTLTSQYDPPFDFEQVLGIAVSSQYELFVLDNVHKKIIKFSRFSVPVESFGGINEAYGQLLDPFQITLDSGKRLFVSDPAQSAVIVFDYLGNYIRDLKHPMMKQPYGLYWGAGERLYVIDKSSNQLFVFYQSLNFLGKVALDAYLNNSVDVAVAYDKSNEGRRIYVLTPQRCFVFDQE